MSVPENIKQKRPSCFGPTEIRALNGRYYVYMVSYERPPDGGWIKKVTGKCVGQIFDEEGFVPNANGLRLLASFTESYCVYTYGAYETLSVLSAGAEDLVKRLFPAEFPSLKVSSLIEAVNHVSEPPLVDYYYRQAFLSLQYPGISFSAASDYRNRSLQMPAGSLPSGGVTAVQYMKKAYLEAFKKKMKDAGAFDTCPASRMLDVLNMIYRIRAPMLNCYLLSPVTGLASHILDAAGVSFDNKIYL